MIPVHLSLNRLREYAGHAIGMVVTDLSEQKRHQAEEIRQAESIHRRLLERALTAQEEEPQRPCAFRLPQLPNRVRTKKGFLSKKF